MLSGRSPDILEDASATEEYRAEKKLPQVGQEPVEAVESELNYPDNIYLNRRL